MLFTICAIVAMVFASSSDAFTIKDVADDYDSRISSNGVDLFWTLVENKNTIRMAISVPAKGWLAVAFSKVGKAAMLTLITVDDDDVLHACLYNRMVACETLME